MFDLQDNPSHKKSEDSITMAKREEHPNIEEPRNTEELNTMVASQIQLWEDMNLIVQQFQNLKCDQEENNTNQNPTILEGEKKINERVNKVEEMIKRARKMEVFLDYHSLSLFPNVRLPPKFKMRPWISLMGLTAQSPI